MEARFSAPVQTGIGAHPASYTMGTGSFPRVKLPRRRVDHPPPPTAEFKDRVELCIYSPSGPSWPVLGCIFIFGRKLRERELVATKRPSIPERSIRCHLHETLTDGQLSCFGCCRLLLQVIPVNMVLATLTHNPALL